MADDKGPRDDRWYFSLMAPNTKGDKFAWLDPTSIYINGKAYHDLLDDLCGDLDADEIDVGSSHANLSPLVFGAISEKYQRSSLGPLS